MSLVEPFDWASGAAGFVASSASDGPAASGYQEAIDDYWSVGGFLLSASRRAGDEVYQTYTTGSAPTSPPV